MNDNKLSIKELRAAAAVLIEYIYEAANTSCAASGYGDKSRGFRFAQLTPLFNKLEERASAWLKVVEDELRDCKANPEGIPAGNKSLCERIQLIFEEILDSDLDGSSSGYDGCHGRNKPSMKLLREWLDTETNEMGTYR